MWHFAREKKTKGLVNEKTQKCQKGIFARAEGVALEREARKGFGQECGRLVPKQKSQPT